MEFNARHPKGRKVFVIIIEIISQIVKEQLSAVHCVEQHIYEDRIGELKFDGGIRAFFPGKKAAKKPVGEPAWIQ